MGFSWDLFFISVWVVDFPASLSLGRSHLWHFVHVSVCVCEREREEKEKNEKVRCLFLK